MFGVNHSAKKQDYYAILGVSTSASENEIHQAYKKEARLVHPDRAEKNKLTIADANTAFKELQEAYEALSNMNKRRLYDSQNGISSPSMQASRNPSSACSFKPYFLYSSSDVDVYHQAAKVGNLNLVRYFVEELHVDIDTAIRGYTALYCAVDAHEWGIMSYLISKGAKCNDQIFNCAMISQQVSVVNRFVAAGFDIKMEHLLIAIFSDFWVVAKYLLHKKPSLKTENYTLTGDGGIPYSSVLTCTLGDVIEMGDIELMEFLLNDEEFSKQISIGCQDPESKESQIIRSMLMIAAEIKDEEDVSLKFLQFLLEEKKFVIPKETLAMIVECPDCSKSACEYLTSKLV